MLSIYKYRCTILKMASKIKFQNLILQNNLANICLGIIKDDQYIKRRKLNFAHIIDRMGNGEFPYFYIKFHCTLHHILYETFMMP